MKIIFNLTRVGLGNNGGSRTIVKSAETLSSLGHEVILFSDINNKYTWEKIKKDVKFMKGRNIPKGDVVIATGYNSVKSTLRCSIKKKFYYIRGYELWRASKSDLIKSYKSLNCIVNSSWLQKFLKSYGIKAYLVYQGIDFEDFYDKKCERNISLGGLFSSRHKTKRHKDIIKIAEREKLSLSLLNKDVKSANSDVLNNWYNTIDIWMAPTELEGLHNPPMEASLCGCGLVCTDHPMSGMSDYAIHNETALVYSSRNIDKAVSCINELLHNKFVKEELNRNMVKLLKEKIGSRKINMEKMVEVFGN